MLDGSPRSTSKGTSTAPSAMGGEGGLGLIYGKDRGGHAPVSLKLCVSSAQEVVQP